ncbi:MAG TPA: mechanosensitive ion channel domain-containing protein [Burkholderiaceae bacterium]|jgi:small-conductance mechanosensitive channel
MTPTLLSDFLSDFWGDLHDTSLLWQIGAIVLCAALGWGLARLLRTTFTADDVQQRMVRMGMESFTKVLSPLLALTLIAITKPVLARWYHVNLLRVAIPLIASFVVVRLGFYVLRRIFARGKRVGSVLLLFEKTFAALVWIGVALYITGLWPDLVQILDETVIPLGRYQASLSAILQALVFIAVTVIAALWAGTMLEERLMKMDTMHSSMRVVLARTGRAFLILIAVLVSLSLVGIDLTVLSVFGGALGVGLGLGLQKIVSSYVSGFVILLERSLAIGDIVTVDKYSGKVTQINTRYTILRGTDGVESVIPNEMLVSGAVQNYSLTDRSIRLATRITVGYQTDVEKVLQLLQQVVASIDRVARTPAPQAMLLQFGADGLELEVGFWILDPEKGQTNILSDVNRAIWKMLQAHQINLPYPQREIRLIDDREGNNPDSISGKMRTSN